ncbi:MAG: hypothetical protein H6850_02540 [Alphaproteobacteria bacterium]|nr:MAG: hypothetical protein H6850_02540 [Alphaproteobacteria bacterium]
MIFDWFISLGGGFSSLQDAEAMSFSQNHYNVTAQQGKTDKLIWFPLSGGVTFYKAPFQMSCEVTGNAGVLAAGDVKDLGQIKLAAGYQITQRCTLSGLLGAQLWRFYRVDTQVSSSDVGFKDKAFYLSDENKFKGKVYTPYFWNLFSGLEVKYQLKKHVYLIGSGQFGFNAASVKKDAYLIAKQDIKALAIEGVSLPQTTNDSMASKMRYKISVGILLEGGVL